MGKKTLYSRKNTCSKYLGLTHNRAYLFTGNLNTIILPKETPNAAYEQYCNSEFNLQQKMLFGASFDRLEFTAEIIIELSRLPYEAKFLKPFILSDVTVIEWDIANTLVF